MGKTVAILAAGLLFAAGHGPGEKLVMRLGWLWRPANG